MNRVKISSRLSQSPKYIFPKNGKKTLREPIPMNFFSYFSIFFIPLANTENLHGADCMENRETNIEELIKVIEGFFNCLQNFQHAPILLL